MVVWLCLINGVGWCVWLCLGGLVVVVWLMRVGVLVGLVIMASVASAVS